MAWQDLPYDSTGELKRLRAFIEDNIDICEWVAVTIIVIQVYNYIFFKSLSILLLVTRQTQVSIFSKIILIISVFIVSITSG